MPTDSDPRDEGCLCQRCGARYKLDVMVPDHIWEKIKPHDAAPGGGLLCGSCVIGRIEKRITGFGVVRIEIEETSICLGQPPAPVVVDADAPDFRERLSQVIGDGVDYRIVGKSGASIYGGVLAIGKYDGYCKGCPKCMPEDDHA